MAKANERKTIEIDRKRIPLRKLLHGKEIREAARALEEFRMKLNEQEFLYGAKITVLWDSYSDAYAVARRPETDKEFEDRLERARIAAEQKREREKKRKEMLAAKKAHEDATRKERAAETIRKIAAEHGLHVSVDNS